MKNSKSNYLKVVALMLLTIAVSCKKDSTESIVPLNANAVESQQDLQDETQNSEYNERNTGALLLPESQYIKLPKVDAANTTMVLPAYKYLTCPPVRSQGSEGSCVAFGTAYAARSIAKYYKTGASSYGNSTNLFSPEFIYNQIKISSSCLSGAYATDALNKMKPVPFFGGGGVCTWTVMPYSSANGCSLQPTAAQKANAANYAITGYATVNPITNDLKNQLLLNRAVIVCGPVDTDFQNLAAGQIYTHYNSAHYVANHCYAVVGYNDARHAFKVMNSWGTNWCNAGFAWIDYDVVSTIGAFGIPWSTGFWSQAYVITASN